MLRFLQDKKFTYPFVCWVIFFIWYTFFSLGAFENLRFKAADVFTNHAHYFYRIPQRPEDIVIVAIDSISLSKVSLKWPWRRSIFAELIEKIARDKPKVTGFDFVFSGPSETNEDDAVFSQALKKLPLSVLASYWYTRDRKSLPLEEFRESVTAVGFVNKPQDSDEVVRNIRTFIAGPDGLEFSFDVKLVALSLGVKLKDIRLDDGRIVINKEFSIPSSPSGITKLDYLFSPQDFEIVPVHQVLNGDTPPDFFKNKIVLVGATAKIIHDNHLTPLGDLPGVIILANSLSMILNKAYIRQVPVCLNYLLLFALSFLILAVNRSYSFLKNSLATIIILASLFLVLLHLRFKGFQFDYFTLFFLCIAGYFISNIYKYTYLIFIGGRLKNLAVTDPFTGFYTFRYFSLQLDEALRDRRRDMSLAAIGVLGYTNLTKQYSYEEMNSFLKTFSRFLEVNLRRELKDIILTSISEGVFLAAIFRRNREKVKASIERIIRQAKDIKFKLADSALSLSLRASIVFILPSDNVSAQSVISLADSSLKEIISEAKTPLVCLEAKQNVWQDARDTPKKDSFDFLILDLEERNKELRKNLQEVKEAQAQTEQAYLEAIRSLIKALEEKDTYTQGHSERVANYALKLAEEAGLSQEECQLIYKAALLHDIGKIGLPDYILHKKEKLNDEELEFIRRHEILSVEILKPIKAFKELLPSILHHHEWFNGTGYPHGLSGDMIPRAAQILTVADAFDAITSGRGYKQGKSIQEAFEIVQKNSGTQFNPQYVEVLRKVLGL
ncbi:MAG: CHASE2 domain-containing protein [Candidatus Omnitrophica bacterium]|nr:CHASE2 domain-containing protein [Candidatus Omnitrophota bacterium]